MFFFFASTDTFLSAVVTFANFVGGGVTGATTGAFFTGVFDDADGDGDEDDAFVIPGFVADAFATLVLVLGLLGQH